MLYIKTIKALKSSQIIHRLQKPFVIKRFYRGKSETDYSLFPISVSFLDEERGYLARFSLKDLMENRITLLGETRELGDMKTTPLWVYNFHYLEFLIALAAEYKRSEDRLYYEKFREYCNYWLDTNPRGKGVGWDPYPMSLRIINLLICFHLFGSIFREDEKFRLRITQSLYVQYRTLILRQEKWLLGNHYFENLKTIVIGSLFFGEEKIYREYISKFIKECNEQILPDGVHFELSPMYHKIVLEGLIRVAYILKSRKKEDYEKICDKIKPMITCAYSLEKGMGRVPLFNDSGNNVAKSVASLTLACKVLFGIKPDVKDCFTKGGFYKIYDRDIALMADCGKIGPDYIPGHGHCDCLSFELAVNNDIIFANSGTYGYQTEKRGYFRSTEAHNTVMINGHEQSLVWSAHRVADRVKIVSYKCENNIFKGVCKNYRGERHARKIHLSDYVLTVTDTVSKGAEAVSFLHIHPKFDYVMDKGSVEILKEDRIVCKIIPVNSIVTVREYDYSPSFGVMEKGKCIEFSKRGKSDMFGYKTEFYSK
ncbi:MAG: alginate lyase family protein [Armatimonadetes bacterium]|nr:alginate lyase family protein [Candidatus Hippobium faecium]